MRTIVITGLAVLGIIIPGVIRANEFGIIMDVTGQPSLQRQGPAVSVEFGQELLVGDTLDIPEKSQLVLVAYKTCEEVTLVESGRVVIINEESLDISKALSWQIRQLPVCYKPELFPYNGPNITGGTLLRGSINPPISSSEIDSMREAAAEGTISNSYLMTLLIFDLQNDNTTQARHSYEQLIRNNPEGSVPDPIRKKLHID